MIVCWACCVLRRPYCWVFGHDPLWAGAVLCGRCMGRVERGEDEEGDL